MSEAPARVLAKKLHERVNGFAGYSAAHHDIGIDLMRDAQAAATALEQLSGHIEELERERDVYNEALEQIAELVGVPVDREGFPQDFAANVIEAVRLLTASSGVHPSG